jgi:hypothetical protein
MAQTAVEWLIEIQKSQSGMLFEIDIEKAKEMEKQQIAEATKQPLIYKNMNKIERAIYDIKLHINDKERQLLICQTEIKSLREQLETLEVIQDNESIPNETIKNQ